MKNKLLQKNLLIIAGSIVPIASVPAIISASQKTTGEIQPLSIIDLTSLFTNGSSIGEFGTEKPTLNSVLTRMHEMNGIFIFDSNIENQTIDFTLNYDNVTSVTISATGGNQNYSGSVQFNFAFEKVKYNLNDFFGGATTYSITDTSIYPPFNPASSDNVTANTILNAIKNYENVGFGGKLDILQLDIAGIARDPDTNTWDGIWNATYENYTVRITPKPESNFYSSDASVDITYQKVRSDIYSSLTSQTLNDYYSIPSGGFVGSDLLYQFYTKSSADEKIILDAVKGSFNWINLDSISPQFTISGDKQYVTSQPISLSISLATKINLSNVITNLNPAQAPELAFKQVPSIQDIKYAIDKNNTNVNWDLIKFDSINEIDSASGTVRLYTTQNNLYYTSQVNVDFTFITSVSNAQASFNAPSNPLNPLTVPVPGTRTALDSVFTVGNRDLGVLNSATPSLLTILTIAKTLNGSFDINLAGDESFAISAITETTGTYSVTLSAQNYNINYTGSVVLTFTLAPKNNYVLNNFFGGSSSYNITTQTTSGNTAFLPNASASITNNSVLIALKGIKDSNDTILDINQLTATTPSWSASDDCYQSIVSTVVDNNFYTVGSTSVTISFNKERTRVNNVLPIHELEYSYMPTTGYNPDALINDWAYANVDQGYTSALTIVDSLAANVTFSVSSLLTDNPSFTLSGNETYTTKTNSTQIQNEYVLSITETHTALSTLITGTHAPNAAGADSSNTNTYLDFTYATPSQDDIMWAINQGGNAGSPFTTTIDWDQIEIALPVSGNAVVLSALSSSVSYWGTVILYFTINGVVPS